MFILQVQFCDDLQRDIWKVFDEWEKEYKIALHLKNNQHQGTVQKTQSSLSTEEIDCARKNDAILSNTVSPYDQLTINCHKAPGMNCRDDSGFSHKPQSPRNEAATSATKSTTTTAAAHTGPVMTAVSFFNSMSQALHNKRSRKSSVNDIKSVAKSSHEERGHGTAAKVHNESGTRKVGNDSGGNDITRMSTKKENGNYGTAATGSLDAATPVTSALQVVDTSAQATFKSVKSIAIHPDSNTFTTASSDDSKAASKLASAARLDFVFEPRTSFDRVRPVVDKLKRKSLQQETRDRVKSFGAAIAAKKPSAFKRTRSVPNEIQVCDDAQTI